MTAEIKLATILEQVLKERGYQGRRKKLCAETGITQAALSQYVKGATHPKLDKLVALATALEVSLDYLVLGRDGTNYQQESPVNYGPLARYVDQSLAKVQHSVAAQSLLVTRIGTIIATQIADTAANIARESSVLSGMLSDDQTVELERYSKVTTIATLTLNYDVLDVKGSPAAGRFLPIVAENISKGYQYRFILAPDAQSWDRVVADLRAVLADSLTYTQLTNGCQFRVASEPFYVGFGIYQLDKDTLRQERPILYEYISKYILDPSRVGYIIGASEDQRGDSLMDRLHLDLAEATAKRLWNSGIKL